MSLEGVRHWHYIFATLRVDAASLVGRLLLHKGVVDMLTNATHSRREAALLEQLNPQLIDWTFQHVPFHFLPPHPATSIRPSSRSIDTNTLPIDLDYE
jgi:hypothetical protein